jgi:hypothetical protein
MPPEDVTRLVAERLNAGDVASVAAPYEPRPCWPTQPTGQRPGRDAKYRPVRTLPTSWQQMPMQEYGEIS